MARADFVSQNYKNNGNAEMYSTLPHLPPAQDKTF